MKTRASETILNGLLTYSSAEYTANGKSIRPQKEKCLLIKGKVFTRHYPPRHHYLPLVLY